MTPAALKLREVGRGNFDVLPWAPDEIRKPADLKTEPPDARVWRLLREFWNDPCELRLARLMGAYRAWRRRIELDKRGLALEAGLDALERFGRRRIHEQELAARCGR